MTGNLLKHFFMTFAQNNDNEYPDKHGNEPLLFRMPRDIVQKLCVTKINHLFYLKMFKIVS